MLEQNYSQIGEKVLHEKLENGLMVYVFPKHEFSKNFAFFATNYGGMDTKFFLDRKWQDSPMGVAHFLEHKMFDTKDGNALQMLTAFGASPNAFTGSAITGYYFEGSVGFYENLETLLSFVSIPYFTQESVDKEQGIIGQEIQMIEDNPNWQLYTQMMGGLYETHPVRNSVAGTKESISHITAETLYLCHNAFYRPSNMVLCVAGDVDGEKVCELAKKILPKDAGAPAGRDYGTESPKAFKSNVTQEMAVSRPLMQLGIKLIPDEKEGLRQKLLGELLCESWVGTSSPLYARLYEDGLVDKGFYYGFESYEGCAFLIMGGESRDPEAVKKAILAEAKRIDQEGLDEGLFLRLKKASYGAEVRRLNSFEHLCVEQARAYFAKEDIWNFPEVYESITKEDVEKALGDWIKEEAMCLSVIAPKGAEA